MSHRIVIAPRDDGSMLIRTWSFDTVTILDMHGRLDVESGSALREALCEIVAPCRRCVVLNLLGIIGIDAAGLGALAEAFTLAQATGVDLRLVVRSEANRELLKRTHLIGVIPTVTTEAEAIASFAAVPSR